MENESCGNRLSEVCESSAHLSNELDNMEKLVAVLDARLQPVLVPDLVRPGSPENTKDAPPPAKSRMATEIDNYTGRVHRTTRLLEGLIARLAV